MALWRGNSFKAKKKKNSSPEKRRDKRENMISNFIPIQSLECRDDDQNEREIYNSPKNLPMSMEQYKLKSILSPMTSEDNLSIISNGTSFTASTIKTSKSLIIKNEQRFDLTELVRDTHTNDEEAYPLFDDYHSSFEDNQTIEELQKKSQIYAEEARRLFQSVLDPNQELKRTESSYSSIPTRNQEIITKNAFRYARSSRRLLKLSQLKQKQKLDPSLHLHDEKFEPNSLPHCLAGQQSECAWNDWDNLSPTTEIYSHDIFYPEKQDGSTINSSFHEDFPGYFPELEFIALLTKSNMQSLAQMARRLLADSTSLFNDDCRYVCNKWDDNHENNGEQVAVNTNSLDVASIIRRSSSIPNGYASMEENKKSSLKQPIFRAQNEKYNKNKSTESLNAIRSFNNYLDLSENCMEVHQEEEEAEEVGSTMISLNNTLHINTHDIEDPNIPSDMSKEVSSIKIENKDEESLNVSTSKTKLTIEDDDDDQHVDDHNNITQRSMAVCEPTQVENEVLPRTTKKDKRFKFIQRFLKRKKKQNKLIIVVEDSECKEEIHTTENVNDNSSSSSSNTGLMEEREKVSKRSDDLLMLMKDECSNKENRHHPLQTTAPTGYIQKETKNTKGTSHKKCDSNEDTAQIDSSLSKVIYFPKRANYSGSSLTMSPLSTVTDGSSMLLKTKPVSECTSPTSRCYEELQKRIDRQPLPSFDFSDIDDTTDVSSRTKYYNNERNSLSNVLEKPSPSSSPSSSVSSLVPNLGVDNITNNSLPQELQNMSDYPTMPLERSFSDIIYYSKVPYKNKDTFDIYPDLRKSSSCPLDRYLYKGCSTTAGEMFESFNINPKTDTILSQKKSLLDPLSPPQSNNDDNNNNNNEAPRKDSTIQIITSLHQGHGYDSIELMEVCSSPSQFAEASAKRGRCTIGKTVKFASESSPQRNFCEQSEGYYLNLLSCSPHSPYNNNDSDDDDDDEKSKDPQQRHQFDEDTFSKASSSAMSSIVDMSRWNGYRLF